MRLDNSIRRPSHGFTLVEVLIVIVILGVLATVTVLAVRGVADRGEESSCTADRRIVEDASRFYMIENAVDAIPATGADDGDQFERTLVDADLLVGVSIYHDLASDGTATTAGASCT